MVSRPSESKLVLLCRSDMSGRTEDCEIDGRGIWVTEPWRVDRTGLNVTEPWRVGRIGVKVISIRGKDDTIGRNIAVEKACSSVVTGGSVTSVSVGEVN